MQEQVLKYLRQEHFFVSRLDNDGYNYPVETKHHVFEEFPVSEVHRRSDIVLWISNRKIINIECKLKNIHQALDQAKDHLWWADYSMICMPHDAFIPHNQRRIIFEEGLGLMLWMKDKGLCEAIAPIKSKKKNPRHRKQIVGRLKAMVHEQSHVQLEL
jgi:hypothetical protein